MEQHDYEEADAYDTAFDIKPGGARRRYNRLASRAGNQLGSAAKDSSFGYLAPVLTAMANTRRWATATRPENVVIVNQTYPVQLLAMTPVELLNNVRIAAQGSAVKAVAQNLMPAAGADLTLDLGQVKSFGVRVRITDSPLNFKFGAYTVTVKDGATPIGVIYLLGSKLPADVIILGISNAGGQATIVPIVNPQVTITGSASGSATVSQSTNVFAETLNLRDLGVVSS